MTMVGRIGMFDDLYQQNEIGTIVVNDLDPNSKEDKKIIDTYVMKQDTGDTISLIPSCNCGEMRGVSYIGLGCPECNTLVTSPIDEEYNWTVWFRRPEGVAPFMSPYVVGVMVERYRITSPRVSIFEYLTDTDYRFKPAEKAAKNYVLIEKLDRLMKERGLERGYNSFIENFHDFIQLLEENGYSGKASKKNKAEFQDWLFSTFESTLGSYLPIPNKSIFIVESADTGQYAQKDMVEALKAVRMFTGIDVMGNKLRTRQNKTSRMLVQLGVNFYKSYLKDTILGKPGIIRKHQTRTRSHFTLRAVVSSRYEPHHYENVVLPWTASMSLLREHILGRLMKRGMALKEALSFFMDHLNTYSSVIDDIFKEIISYTDHGLPIKLIRNPELHRGSIVFCRVKEIKTNPNDNTMDISDMLANTFNMDHDGDEMNVSLLLTKVLIEEAHNFEVHHNLLDLTGPNKFSSILNMSKSINDTIGNWMHYRPTKKVSH